MRGWDLVVAIIALYFFINAGIMLAYASKSGSGFLLEAGLGSALYGALVGASLLLHGRKKAALLWIAGFMIIFSSGYILLVTMNAFQIATMALGLLLLFAGNKTY